MKIEEIQAMWDVDCKIDPARLAQESLNIPYLHNTYLKILMKERAILKDQTNKYNEFKFLKQLYYSGKLNNRSDVLQHYKWEPQQLTLGKSDVEIYMEADREVVEKKTRLNFQEEKVSFLSEIVNQIAWRHNVIKNAIEWNKFTSGAG